MKASWLILGGAMLACGASACADVAHDAVDVRESNAGTSGGGGGVGGGGVGGGDVQLRPERRDAFDITIEERVTVGAFALTLHTARVTPDVGEPGATRIEVNFDADNLSLYDHTPLAPYLFGGLVLDVAGEPTEGTLDMGPVPPRRSRSGRLMWRVTDPAITLDDVAHAVIRLGLDEQHQVKVPLDDPSATVGLNDIKVDDGFSVERGDGVILHVDAVRLQWSSRQHNTLHAFDTARLVFTGTLTGEQDVDADASWLSTDNIVLERPDGRVVEPTFISSHGQRREERPVTIELPIRAPSSGHYVFGMRDLDGHVLQRAIEVP